MPGFIVLTPEEEERQRQLRERGTPTHWVPPEEVRTSPEELFPGWQPPLTLDPRYPGPQPPVMAQPQWPHEWGEPPWRSVKPLPEKERPPTLGRTPTEKGTDIQEKELRRILADTAQTLSGGAVRSLPGDPTMAYGLFAAKGPSREEYEYAKKLHLQATEDLWFLRHPEYSLHRGVVPAEMLYMVNLADAVRGLKHAPGTMSREDCVAALNTLNPFVRQLERGDYPALYLYLRRLGLPDLKEIKELRSYIRHTKPVETLSPRARATERLELYELSPHENFTLRFARAVPPVKLLAAAISPRGLRDFDASLGNPKGIQAWAAEIGGKTAGAIMVLTPIFRGLNEIATATTAGQAFQAAHPYLSQSLLTAAGLGTGGGILELTEQIASGELDLDRVYAETLKDALAGLVFGAAMAHVGRIWNAAKTFAQKTRVRKALLSALGLPEDTLTNQNLSLLMRLLPKVKDGVLPSKMDYLKAIRQIATRHRELGGPIFRALYYEAVGRPWIPPVRPALPQPEVEANLLQRIFRALQQESGVFRLPITPTKAAPNLYSPPTLAQVRTVEKAGQYFAALVPEFARRAMAVFSGYNEAARDEKVQEVMVIAWKDLLRLRNKGIANLVRPAALLKYAIQHVKVGALTFGKKVTDAMSEAARIQGRTAIVPMEGIGVTLVDQRVRLPSEIVRIRHDYGGFLKRGGLTRREKEVFVKLARGYTGSEIARQLGLTKGSISQTRGRIQEKIEKYLPGIAPREAHEAMRQRWAYLGRAPESAILADKALTEDFLLRGGLTPREERVFVMLSRGLRPVDIARELGVDRSYVAAIRWRIQTKVHRYLSTRRERAGGRSTQRTSERVRQLRKVKTWLEKRHLEPLRAR